MPINDPRDISGLVAWYSADHQATLQAPGVLVSSWADLSDAGHPARLPGSGDVVGTYTGPPILESATGAAGGPALLFTDRGGLVLPFSFTGSAPGEVFATMRSDLTYSTWSSPWKFGNTADASHHPGTNDLTIYEQFGWSGRTSFNASGLDAWHRYNVAAGGTALRAWINGALAKTQAIAAPAWAPYFVLGGSPPQRPYAGRMGMVLIYDRVLTDPERADVNTWMAAHPSGGHRYVPPVPPNPPTDLAVTAITYHGGQLTWAAPPTGPAPAGYTVTVNGGAPTDVGDVLTHSLTDLADATLHTVEVRAYTTAGASAPTAASFTTLALPPGFYRAVVTLADQTWTAAKGDPPELGVTLPLAFGWQTPQARNGYPAQPDPEVATPLVLVTPTGADLSGVDIGSRCQIKLWVDPAPTARPFVTFNGVVADIEAEPDPHGIRWQIVATDLTPEHLAPVTVNAVEWPAEFGDVRVARIMSEAGVTWSSDLIGNVFDITPPRSLSAQEALTEALTEAATYSAGPTSAPGRILFRPNVDDNGDPLVPAFTGHYVPARSDAIDVISAAYIPATASWRRTRYTDGSWVHIDHPGGPTIHGDTRGTALPRVRVGVLNTDALADLILAAVPGYQWLTGEYFTVDVFAADPATRAAIATWLYQDPDTDPYAWATRVIVVEPINVMPGLMDRYAGMLTALRVRLEPGGRLYLDFALRPDVPAFSTVTQRWMDEPPTATWLDEPPTATWWELRTYPRETP